MSIMRASNRIPFLPLRNALVFPGTTAPLSVGRAASIKAVLHANTSESKRLVVGAQRLPQPEEPLMNDIFDVAVLCQIEQINPWNDQGYQLLVTGISRFKIHELINEGNSFEVVGVELGDEADLDHVRTEALLNSVKSLAIETLYLLPLAEKSLLSLIEKVEDPSYFSYLVASFLNLSLAQKQSLLEERFVNNRLELVIEYLRKQREVLKLQKEIQEKMTSRLNKTQREAMLREQLQAIKEELGEVAGAEASAIEERVKKTRFPEDVQKIVNQELGRLQNLSAISPEYRVIRDYLQCLVDTPWYAKQEEPIDILKSRKILDEDHFGLFKVKKRILQYLSVAKLKNDLRGSILCLVGPPGVGKTSLGKSIAKSLGRKFSRLSLGGVHDEAEIRGHRRTYIGAIPGRIIQNIQRAGVKNPVFMLDEIDKLGSSYHGDPASAMLEVLDPEQNATFVDHYLDVPFDLSDVFFIATANVVDSIPVPLLDRMEIIEVSGYTEDEKFEICKRYLLPKQILDHGLSRQHIEITDESLRWIILHYTREAGVRELSRQMASLCRGVAEAVVEEKPLPIQLTTQEIERILGPAKFEREVHERASRAGVVTGMAWTAHGGDILFVESNVMKGSGELELTGQLGEVMKESAKIALSFIRSENARFCPSFDFNKHDLHIHVPAGSIPKDGPSAGVTLLVSLISLLSNTPVDPEVAMTGEITLRGVILPVGGIKEKIIAASRAGITEVYLPAQNKKDLADVPEEVQKKLKIELVESIDQLVMKIFGTMEAENLIATGNVN